jgi:predicted  nucleic acid-binding Zn-ribbon protein
MEIKSSARQTMKSLGRELDTSTFYILLQDAKDTIEGLIEEVTRLEDESNDKDDQIKDLQDAMDEMERNNE